MSRLDWDKIGDRRYEAGLDRGVLFLPNGSAVSWSGLTSVTEKSTRSSSPIYYEGVKIAEVVSINDFEASIKALTYPDEFGDLEGSAPIRRGASIPDQMPKIFSLAYRTRVADDTNPDQHYKLHLLYNLLAFPSDKSFSTLTESPSLTEFEWSLVSFPQQIPGMRPTSQIILDTTELDPWLLEDIENQIYGTVYSDPTLLSLPDMLAYLKDWARVKIVDNGDGTWTATEARPGFISMIDEGTFRIEKVNAVYDDDDTFDISDTIDDVDAPSVKVRVNLDGTFTVSTDNENVIVVHDDGTFEILGMESEFLGPDIYRIQDKLLT